jgi:uncharacterized Zn finger protein
MDKTLKFVLLGDKGDDVHVSFTRSGDNLTSACTCEAGKMEMYCNHVFQLLAGKVGHLVSNNAAEVEQLPAMASGTDVATALETLIMAEAALANAKTSVATAKQNLSKALHD